MACDLWFMVEGSRIEFGIFSNLRFNAGSKFVGRRPVRGNRFYLTQSWGAALFDTHGVELVAGFSSMIRSRSGLIRRPITMSEEEFVVIKIKWFPGFEWAAAWSYLTQSVFQVVLHKLNPTQIRQLIPYISTSKGWVDGFVGELTSVKRM